MACRLGSLSPYLLFLLLFVTPISNALTTTNGVVVEGMMSRRRLNNFFRVCALCTCCGGPKGLCLPSPCCYAINCNIPNRPFGSCALTPKACNCIGCHL